MSRRAYLHADANATFGAQASATVQVDDGTYHVMARYEAGFRFSSPFRIEVKQGAATLFSKVYGLRTTPKVWAFQTARAKDASSGCGAGLQPECRWIYSATENMVWEGTTDTVNLTAGAAPLVLTVVGADGSAKPADSVGLRGSRWGAEAPDGALIAERNVDSVLLTPNSSDVAFRMNTSLFPSTELGSRI